MSSLFPARIVFDLAANVLEINLRLAESFADLFKRANLMSETAHTNKARLEEAAPGANESDAPKRVYRFGAGSVEGSAKMRDLLGGKGANLAEMANLGLPVP